MTNYIIIALAIVLAVPAGNYWELKWNDWKRYKEEAWGRTQSYNNHPSRRVKR